MDLALHLGMTEASLAESMTQRELQAWQMYAAKRMLPWRRMELYMAQISMLVVKAAGGGKDLTISDFMFEPKESEGDDVSSTDLREAFGFSPRRPV